MKKFISVILMIVLFLSVCVPTFAAEEVKPEINIYKYDDNTGQYNIPATAAVSGDLLLVRVSFNQKINSLASLRLTVSYPQEKVSYVKSSFTPELVAGNTQAGNPVFTEKDGKLIVFFGKSLMTSGDEIATDVENIASFIFCCEGNKGDISFEATIDNALDKNYKDVVLKAKKEKVTIALQDWTLSESEKEVFASLKTIVYAPGTVDDSKAGIDKADMIYKEMTASEKVKFKNQYPELFENYRTAWTRYYDASLEASQAAIKAEVERFASENREALMLTNPEQVDDSNYQKVLDAIEAYGKLTAQAQVKALDYKAGLDKLQDTAQKIADRIQADADAETYFIRPYESTLWNLKESDVNNETYADLMVLVAEAQAEYDNLSHDKMSDIMKEKVTGYYDKLQKISKRITELAKQAGENAKIQKEIEAFTEKWHVVTRLTALTVGVNDKTAIEMMLEDFAKLSDVAQQRLASRKTMAEQMLELIKGMNDIQDTVGGNSGITVVPSGGTTQEVIKEVQVPVETLVTKLLSNTVFRNVPTIVYVAVILMVVAIISLLFPLMLHKYYRKKNNKLKGGEDE